MQIFLLFSTICTCTYANKIKSICPKGLVGQTIYKIDDEKLTYTSPDIYLEASGTQFIDTGFIPTQNTRIVASIEVTDNALLGAYIISKFMMAII